MFCPSWSTEAQVIVLERERIVALSPLARASGLRSGMRHASIPLLLPHASIHVREAGREAQALQDSALALLQYTPQVALAEQATLLLDIGASLRLFGGIRTLCKRVAASMRRLGFSVALSCAPTARGAWLLAHGCIGERRSLQWRCATLPTLARLLARLPVTLLPPLQPFLPWLAGLGCHTLQELCRLPRAGLQRRCGKAVLDMLDAAHGQAPELFDWIEAPPQFKSRFEFFERIEHVEAMTWAVQRLLAQMCGWLCARHLAVQGIHLLLQHERGHHALEPTPIVIQLGEPGWQETHLLLLLKERLRLCDLPAPVMALELAAVQVQAMAPVCSSLFPEPGGTPLEYQRLLELLSARLGNENVLQAQPQADYRPEIANHWVSVLSGNGAANSAANGAGKSAGNGARNSVVKHAFKDATAGMAGAAQAIAARLPRPCWLLAKPVALLMRGQRPFYGSPLKLVTAPERIEAGWWQGELVLRDYFVAQGQDQVDYWIYRERLQDEPRWFLHGLFG